MAEGKIPPGGLACVPLDRAAGKVYKQTVNIDLVPTLTTSNRYLFVFSTDDLDEPLGKRAFARFLLPAERMALQGFPLAYAEFIPEGMHVKASGNAYPVPVVGAVLFPILRQLGNLEPGTLLNWPPEDANSGVVP